MKYKAILFDMDGTLFNSEYIAKLAWMEYGRLNNLPITDEFYLTLIGRSRQSAKVMFDKYMPAHFNEDEAYAYAKEYTTKFKKEHGPLPKTNLPKLFTYLKNKGYKLAIVSSSARSTIDFNLSFENLSEYFDILVDGNMVTNGKPAPDIYLYAANQLNIAPSECLVVEDSKNGILSGNAAGMDVVMVIDMVQPDEEIKKCCLKIMNHLDEILEII